MCPTAMIINGSLLAYDNKWFFTRLRIPFASATEVFLAHTGALQVRLLLLLLHKYSMLSFCVAI